MAVALAVGETPPSLSIPVPKDSFIPSFKIISKHASIESDKVLITVMNLTTSVPTIRLDNLPFAIKSITCSANIITLSFYEENLRKQAFEIWNDYKDLAFLIGHEQGCNGKDEGTFMVHDMRLDPNGTDIVAEADSVDREYVVDEWDAVVTEEAPSHKSMFMREKKLNLNFDLNKYFADRGNPNFGIFKQHLVHFENCYTNGSVKYKFELHGHRKTLLSYKFKIYGEFNATADLKLGFLPNLDVTLFKTAILTIPMTPLSIPGVLIIGPAFAIELALIGFADAELTVGFGFDLHIPIDFEMASKDLKSDPIHKVEDKAKFNPHPLKFTIQRNITYIGAAINIIPEIVFGVQIMSSPVLAIKGIFVNQLGMIHRFKNATACPGTNSIEIFHRHIIGASLDVLPLTWMWRFFDSGRKLLYASCKADAGKYYAPAAKKFINATDNIQI